MPKVQLSADILYARVLSGIAERGAKTELKALENEIRELTVKPDYAAARPDLNAELADIAAAIPYEQQAMQAIAKAGGTIDLNEETAKKFNAKKGKITGYKESSGLSVDVPFGPGNIGTSVTATGLPAGDIVKAAPDKAALAQVRYFALRGDAAAAKELLPNLKGEELKRWERKLKLMSSGEAELMAQGVFKNLKTLAEAKSWKTFRSLATEYEALYEKTLCYNENIVPFLEWQVAAKLALTPVEGLEAGGKFFAESWPKTNLCTIKIQTHADSGNKSILVEGMAGTGEKSAFSRQQNPPLDLTGKTEIHFRTRHDSRGPLQIAVAFITSEGEYFETVAVEAGLKEWHQNTIRIDGPVFKGAATQYLTHDQALPVREGIKRISLVVYTGGLYKLEVDKIEVK